MIIHEDEYSIVHQGDALAVLTTLETASLDGLVTDPPYSSGGMTRSDRMAKTTTKYVQSDSANQSLSDFSGDNRDQRAYQYWMAMWLAEASRVLKPGAPVLLFTDWRQLPSTTDSLQAGGYVWRGIVPWVKPNARPMAGRFTNQAEYIVWGSNGSMGLDFENAVLPGFYQANSPRDREHITQKPVDVMRQLVRIVPEGGQVLGPFLGSGTTAVAALIEGRRVVGVERVPEFARISVRRILQTQFKDTRDAGGMLDFSSEADG